MSEYYVWITEKYATSAQAARINRAVEAIDPQMSFVRLSVLGTSTRGYLARPNDGMNSANLVRENNERCVAIAEKILA